MGPRQVQVLLRDLEPEPWRLQRGGQLQPVRACALPPALVVGLVLRLRLVLEPVLDLVLAQAV